MTRHKVVRRSLKVRRTTAQRRRHAVASAPRGFRSMLIMLECAQARLRSARPRCHSV